MAKKYYYTDMGKGGIIGILADDEKRLMSLFIDGKKIATNDYKQFGKDAKKIFDEDLKAISKRNIEIDRTKFKQIFEK